MINKLNAVFPNETEFGVSLRAKGLYRHPTRR